MDSIKSIRNREGDSHGGSQEAHLLHAKFVVNITGSLVEFLVGLRNKKRDEQASKGENYDSTHGLRLVTSEPK